MDMVSRFLILLRFMGRCAGRVAFARAAPLYFGIAIAASIIFSPLGMRAAEVTHMFAAFRGFRLGLLGFWLIATTPAASALLCEPTVFILRSLPVARWQFFLAQGFLL